MGTLQSSMKISPIVELTKLVGGRLNIVPKALVFCQDAEDFFTGIENEKGAFLSFRNEARLSQLAGKAGNMLTSELGSLIILLSHGYTAMKYEDFSDRRNEKREVEMKRDPLCHFD